MGDRIVKKAFAPQGVAVRLDAVGTQVGEVDAIARDSQTSWYDPGLHDATFLILPSQQVSACSDGTPAQWLVAAREAFGRAAEPWEVADVIVFLASGYSSYMTGEIVSVSSQHP